MDIPIRLEKPPLTQAVFELRIESCKQLLQLLPGILYQKFGKNIEAKELSVPIPAAMAEQLELLNPQFKFQPKKSVTKDNIVINFGENNIIFVCEGDYPGWHAFSRTIKEILEIIVDSFDSINIERYSMKTINMLSDQTGMVSSKLKLKIEANGFNICDDNQFFSLRTDYKSTNLVCVVNVISHAAAKNSSMMTVKTGTLLDVDAICEPYTGSLSEFLSDFDGKAEVVHGEAKRRFFSLISDEQLKKFGPIYV